jgi:hypothetical protein
MFSFLASSDAASMSSPNCITFSYFGWAANMGRQCRQELLLLHILRGANVNDQYHSSRESPFDCLS